MFDENPFMFDDIKGFLLFIIFIGISKKSIYLNRS